MTNKTTEPAAPEPLGDSEGTATQVVAGLEPVAFKRENRYVVLKQKDIAMLSDIDREVLGDICHNIKVIRANRGKKGISAVVVEHDWPEYEYVWGLIKHRMEMK